MKKLRSYRGTEPYIFISYAHKDKKIVEPILSKMQSDGYRVWFDEGIDPGTEWDENIARHISESGYFIALISKNYLASENCKDELNYARDLGIKRLLVYIENIELPKGMAMRMNRIQSVFKYRYTDENDFYSVLCSADGISDFRSVKNAVSQNYFVASSNVKTITYEDGSTYTGSVNADGKPHGRGVVRFASGSFYVGEFCDGKLNGQGMYRYANGDVFRGEYRDGKRNGQGLYRHANGDAYEGEYRDDKCHGQGVYRYENGDIFEGEYRDGKRNGQGIYRYVDGTVKKGIWENGKLIS